MDSISRNIATFVKVEFLPIVTSLNRIVSPKLTFDFKAVLLRDSHKIAMRNGVV